MIEIGDRVRVRTNGGSAAARKYAGCTGRVITIAPGSDAFFVQIDGNFKIETAIEERDLVRLGGDEEVGYFGAGEGTSSRIQASEGMYELPPWLRPTYVLDESDPDIPILRRADGSFVAAFSAQGATREGIRQAAEENWRQQNPLGAELHTPSESRSSGQGADPREKVGWEQFLEMERLALEERRNGQLARALGRALPGESQEELYQLAEKDRRRAEEGFVEIIREGEPVYKHIEELNPEDRLSRLRAERARMLWLQARLEEKNR